MAAVFASAEGIPAFASEQLSLKLQAKLEQAFRGVKARERLAVECCQDIVAALRTLGEEWSVTVFGSFAHGLSTLNSDLDATIIRATNHSAAEVARELEIGLLPLLLQSNHFELVEKVFNARVPLLRLRYDRQLDLDLCFQNSEAVANTNLLLAYVKMSAAVTSVLALVKIWAKINGVCGARQGNLSSYALMLMALYAMQVDPALDMPVLRARDFITQGEPPQVKWRVDEPLSAILYRFFSFYAYYFRWNTEVVAVHLGKRTLCDDDRYHRDLNGRHLNRLHIADPILTSRNLHCVLKPDRERALHRALCEAAQCMQLGAAPIGLTLEDSAETFQIVDTLLAAATRREEAGMIPSIPLHLLPRAALAALEAVAGQRAALDVGAVRTWPHQ